MNRQNLFALLVLSSNCLVLFFLFSLNDYWGRYGIYFYLPGLFFLFGSTRLSNRNGAMVAFLTGLLIDSTTTSPFGLHAFGLTLCHLIAREGGEGMEATRGIRPHIYQQLANLLLIATLTISSFVQSAETSFQGWHRLSIDIIASQLLLFLLGSWFLAFQNHLPQFDGVGSHSRSVAK
ncbi:MAG: rod shape-determining protein MreD [Opitutae bacterium]|nr:rod shape-determining protein MreD [Opitutae bacterium]